MFTVRRHIRNYEGLTGIQRYQKKKAELLEKECAKRMCFVGMHAAYFQEREHAKLISSMMNDIDRYDSGIHADQLQLQRDEEAEDRIKKMQEEFDVGYRSGDRLWHWIE